MYPVVRQHMRKNSKQNYQVVHGQWHKVRCSRLRRSVRLSLVSNHDPSLPVRTGFRLTSLGLVSGCPPRKTPIGHLVETTVGGVVAHWVVAGTFTTVLHRRIKVICYIWTIILPCQKVVTKYVFHPGVLPALGNAIDTKDVIVIMWERLSILPHLWMRYELETHPCRNWMTILVIRL